MAPLLSVVVVGLASVAFVLLEANAVGLVAAVKLAFRRLVNRFGEVFGQVLPDLSPHRGPFVAELDPDFDSEVVFEPRLASVKNTRSADHVSGWEVSGDQAENEALPELLDEVGVFAFEVDLELAALTIQLVLPHGLDPVLEDAD